MGTRTGDILQPSSGIGLSLVRELVELHHGIIEVSSQPGNGSCFSVQFPTRRDILEQDPQVEFILADSYQAAIATDQNTFDMKPVASSPTSNQQSDNKDALTILIVEDNPELRTFLHNILADSYQAAIATDQNTFDMKPVASSPTVQST